MCLRAHFSVWARVKSLKFRNGISRTFCPFCRGRDLSQTCISGTLPGNLGDMTSLRHLYVQLPYQIAKWSIGSRIGNSVPYSGGVIARTLGKVRAVVVMFVGGGGRILQMGQQACASFCNARLASQNHDHCACPRSYFRKFFMVALSGTIPASLGSSRSLSYLYVQCAMSCRTCKCLIRSRVGE